MLTAGPGVFSGAVGTAGSVVVVAVVVDAVVVDRVDEDVVDVGVGSLEVAEREDSPGCCWCGGGFPCG